MDPSPCSLGWPVKQTKSNKKHFHFLSHLEFPVALRLAEGRRKSIVGAAAVVVAARRDRQWCNRITAVSGNRLSQFALAGFAEAGQSPFASIRGTHKMKEINRKRKTKPTSLL